MPDLETENYVLIVDDDPNALALMSIVVESLGLAVRGAADGHQALDYIHEQPPGFVVLDLMLPGMDGFAVLRHLQMNPHTCDVPILIVTATRLREDDVLDLRGTVLGVVQKGHLDLESIGSVILATIKGEIIEETSAKETAKHGTDGKEITKINHDTASKDNPKSNRDTGTTSTPLV